MESFRTFFACVGLEVWSSLSGVSWSSSAVSWVHRHDLHVDWFQGCTYRCEPRNRGGDGCSILLLTVRINDGGWCSKREKFFLLALQSFVNPWRHMRESLVNRGQKSQLIFGYLIFGPGPGPLISRTESRFSLPSHFSSTQPIRSLSLISLPSLTTATSTSFSLSPGHRRRKDGIAGSRAI
jgi:hypothetical protein